MGSARVGNWVLLTTLLVLSGSVSAQENNAATTQGGNQPVILHGRDVNGVDLMNLEECIPMRIQDGYVLPGPASNGIAEGWVYRRETSGGQGGTVSVVTPGHHFEARNPALTRAERHKLQLEYLADPQLQARRNRTRAFRDEQIQQWLAALRQKRARQAQELAAVAAAERQRQLGWQPVVTGSSVAAAGYEPVAGLTVTIKGHPMLTAITDASGHYVIDNVPPGRHWLALHAPLETTYTQQHVTYVRVPRQVVQADVCVNWGTGHCFNWTAAETKIAWSMNHNYEGLVGMKFKWNDFNQLGNHDLFAELLKQFRNTPRDAALWGIKLDFPTGQDYQRYTLDTLESPPLLIPVGVRKDRTDVYLLGVYTRILNDRPSRLHLEAQYGFLNSAPDLFSNHQWMLAAGYDQRLSERTLGMASVWWEQSVQPGIDASSALQIGLRHKQSQRFLWGVSYNLGLNWAIAKWGFGLAGTYQF